MFRGVCVQDQIMDAVLRRIARYYQMEKNTLVHIIYIHSSKENTKANLCMGFFHEV